jgi:hypothetical protein
MAQIRRLPPYFVADSSHGLGLYFARVIAHNPLNELKQLWWGKRPGQKGSRAELLGGVNPIVSEAYTRDDNRNGGIASLQLSEKPKTIHWCHVNIGDDQIKNRVISQNVQCVFSVLSFHDVMAGRLKNCPDQDPQALLVVYYQHACHRSGNDCLNGSAVG